MGKGRPFTNLQTGYYTHFNWRYERDKIELAKLYSKAKLSQWNAETDLDWSHEVDPYNPSIELFDPQMVPLRDIRTYRNLTNKQQQEQRAQLLCWMLSQFLHGEQGALMAAAQVTEAVQFFDGKLYGATQVMDEGRHVEVFHRYLDQKMNKVYQINDNLFVIITVIEKFEEYNLPLWLCMIDFKKAFDTKYNYIQN